MSEDLPPQNGLAEPPETGNPRVDEALATVRDLTEVPLAEHHDRLTAVQDALSAALEESRQPAPSPIPAALRPGHGTDARG
ncbi:hypothetical protein [Luteococcus sp. OSA5]|uniref:hypothetical protein n=1 Tax=Luteococcus sp. OSA5 TaxID=3401630 RepID=UPI003B43877A